MTDPKEIILHIIDSDNPKHDNIETIRAWHMEERGWVDVGYHKYINSQGEIQDGRPLDQMGAHTKGHNKNTFGLATFGKFGTQRTQKQYAGIIGAIMDLKIQFPSIIKVSQHSDHDQKKPHCAGFTKSQMYYFNLLTHDIEWMQS